MRRILLVNLFCVVVVLAMVTACGGGSGEASAPGELHVLSTFPAAGKVGVGVEIPIRVFFARPIDPTSVLQGTITCSPPVPGPCGPASTGSALLQAVEPLEQDTTYTVTCHAGVRDVTGEFVSQDHVWSFQTGSGDTPDLTAPVMLGAEPISDTLIRVRWEDRSEGEEGYRLERSTNGGPFDFALDIPPNVEEWRDAGLSPSTEYAYRVTAFHGTEVSETSSPLPGETEAPFKLGFVIDLPTHSTTGTYVVSLDNAGTLASTSAFIEEDTDSGFGSPTRWAYQNISSWPLTRTITDNTRGVYYYRGGTALGGGLFVYSPPKSIVVQSSGTVQATIYPKFDSTIIGELLWGSEGSLSYRSYPESTLDVGNNWLIYPNGGVGRWANAALLYFDLDDLIGSATISSATLKLYANVLALDQDTRYRVAACSDDWDQKKVAWVRRPDVWLSDQVTAAPPTSTTYPVEWDVTAIVRRWVTSAWPNYGFFVLDDDFREPYGPVIRSTCFESLERYVETSPGRRPQLVIRYEP